MKTKRKLFIVIAMVSVLLMPSCIKNEEDINKEINEKTVNLLTYNWQLNNIQMSYEKYKGEVGDYFIDDESFDAHIRNHDLSPIILEDVTKVDDSLVKKYKSKGNYNYDLLDIKISKVYGDASSSKKYCYIQMVVSPKPFIQQKDLGTAYTKADGTLNEQRNVMVEWTKEKSHWKIASFQGNAYLVHLKDKLSHEFVNRYTEHSGKPIAYTQPFELVHDFSQGDPEF